MKRVYAYGQRPPDIGAKLLGLGWIAGIRFHKRKSASTSFWHRHAETALICSIKGEVSYEFHGLKPIRLSAGSFLVIPAQVEHRHLDEIDPVNQRIEFLLNVNPCKKAPFSIISHSAAIELHAKLLKKALVPCKCTQDLFRCFSESCDLIRAVKAKYTDIELGYLRLLSTQILYATSLPRKKQANKTSPRILDEILDWLDQHFNEKMDIDRLVAKTGYSRSHVFTLFRKQTGLTPADYLFRLRVRKACSMLQDTSIQAKEIARACGFSSQSTFNTIFRKQTGLSPSAWRQRNSPIPSAKQPTTLKSDDHINIT